MFDRPLSGLAPAFLCLGFGGWLGTFPGAADASRAILAHSVLFAVLALASAGVDWGRSLAAWVWIAPTGALVASAVASPVPRAAWTALALWPCLVILPRLLARTFDEGAKTTVPALSAAVGGIAAWSLWAWRVDGTDGTSMPLGHHNLLAIFLLTLLPLTLLPWRDGGWRRGLAVACGSLTLASLLATRSLAGAVGLGAVALAWALGSRRGRPWRLAGVTIAGLGGLAVYGRRLQAILAGEDPSVNARLAYLEAGWQGFLERPVLGWGPGSTNWTVHEHFRPVPGVHPPDQVLADLHCLPLQVLYELGAVGLVALVGAAWWVMRGVRRRALGDPGLARAGGLGLLGAGVASLGGAPLSVTAIPVALAVAAGAWLGAHERPESRRSSLRWLPAVAAVALLAWQAPRDLAHLQWDRALRSETKEGSVEHLRRAVALDPAFPLYRWRLALLEDDGGQALRAAEDGRGVSGLWTTAGALLPAGSDRRAALDRSCALSHFAAIPPLLRLRAGFDPAVAARTAASSPLLLASPVFDPPGRLDATLERLEATGGLPRPWLGDLRSAVATLRDVTPRHDLRRLALGVDGDPAVSLSLHAFRRTPWPARIAVVELHGTRISDLAPLPAASALAATERSLFASSSCRLGE